MRERYVEEVVSSDIVQLIAFRFVPDPLIDLSLDDSNPAVQWTTSAFDKAIG